MENIQKLLDELRERIKAGVSLSQPDNIPIFIFLRIWETYHQGNKQTTRVIQDGDIIKVFIQYQEEVLEQDKSRRDRRGWLCLSHGNNRSWIDFIIGVESPKGIRGATHLTLSFINGVLSISGNRNWYLPAGMYEADAARATETEVMAIFRTIPKEVWKEDLLNKEVLS